MKTTFELSGEIYDPKNNTNHYGNVIEPRIDIVSSWIKEGKKILDLGCYNGLYSSFFKNGKNEIWGMDANRNAVRDANDLGIKATVGDLEGKFPFEDEYFDTVHAGEVIEHLFDTDTFIRECRRVLSSKGILIITTPNTLSLPRRILYFLGNGKFFEASNTFSTEKIAVGHIRFFTKSLLKDFVESNGFMMVRFTSDYINFPFGIKSKMLAKIFPSFGRTLIMKFIKC